MVGILLKNGAVRKIACPLAKKTAPIDNLSRHTRPDGSFIDYTYNSRNLFGTLSADGPPPVAEYTYNLRSQIQQTEIENGLFTVTRGYDGAGRLTGVTNGGFDSTGYTLSPDGRRTGINRNGQVETYEYDNARQVEEATYTGLSTVQSWQYDGAGNRTSATTNGSTTNYSANAVNEYLSISGMPGTPSYDDNGNALDWNVRPYGSSTVMAADFTWNINNELVGAVNSSGDSAAYAYDALGRRVARTLSVGGVSSTTWFFTNAWNVELEHNGTAFTRRLTWGLDLSGSLQGAGGVGGLIMVENLPGGSGTPVAHFPAYDGNGNITTWVDAIGTITARLRYDAYGNLLSCTDGSGTLISPLALPSDYGFSTKPADRVTGLLYYGYRYYDPVTGRWPSRDPIEEQGGLNLYGFCFNAPIFWTDDLGHTPMSGWGSGGSLNPDWNHNFPSQEDRSIAAGERETGSAEGSHALIIELIGALGAQKTIATRTVLAPLPGGSIELFMGLTGSVCPCEASDGSIGIQFTGTAKAEITGGIGYVLQDKNLKVKTNQGGKYTNVHRKDDPKQQSIKGLGGRSNRPEITDTGTTATLSSGGLAPCETTGSLQFNIGARGIGGVGFWGGVIDTRFGTFGTAETKWDFVPRVEGSWGTGQPIGLRIELYGNAEVSGKWATKE
jgi:RHS repeat-associated protein